MNSPRRFLFRLASKLGCLVKHLEAELEADELLEWRAFYLLEPWGTAVEDYRFGKLLSAKSGKSPIEHFPGYFEDEAAEAIEQLRTEQLSVRLLNQQRGTR